MEVEGYDGVVTEWRDRMGTVDWESTWKFVREDVDASVPEWNG